MNRYRDFKKSLHQVHHKGKTTGVVQSAVDSLIAVLLNFPLQKHMASFEVFKISFTFLEINWVNLLNLMKHQAL